MDKITHINLGSGDQRIYRDGGIPFTNVDLYDETADVRADITELPFPDNSIEEIRSYQVVEHIPYNKTEQMFAEMYRVLKPGGHADVECPDILYAAKEIVRTGDIEDKWINHLWGQYYRPWDIERYGPNAVDHPGSKHVTGFTLKRIKRICEPLGFTVTEPKTKYMDVPETLSVILTKGK